MNAKNGYLVPMYLCIWPLEFLKYHDKVSLRHFVIFPPTNFALIFRHPGAQNRKQIKRWSKNCFDDVISDFFKKWLKFSFKLVRKKIIK